MNLSEYNGLQKYQMQKTEIKLRAIFYFMDINQKIFPQYFYY